MKQGKLRFLLSILLLALAGCSGGPAGQPEPPARLRVVATTSIVADIVRQVGGDAIELATLLPVGTDPHSFQPAPRDAALLSQADIIFINGAGLEEFLAPLLENAGSNARVVSLSEDVPLRSFSLAGESVDEHESGQDPHVWTDPTNVVLWVKAVEKNLSDLDPTNSQGYQSQAESFIRQLNELDTWIQTEVEQVPPEKRKLVTDHISLGYFAGRYGFEQIGAVIPAASTMAQPSAQELALLEDAVKSYAVTAIFIDQAVNPALAQRIAEDTGVRLATFYSGSLSAAGGPASTYLEYMRYNVRVIVENLK